MLEPLTLLVKEPESPTPLVRADPIDSAFICSTLSSDNPKLTAIVTNLEWSPGQNIASWGYQNPLSAADPLNSFDGVDVVGVDYPSTPTPDLRSLQPDRKWILSVKEAEKYINGLPKS